MTARRVDATVVAAMAANSCSTCGLVAPSTKAPLLAVGPAAPAIAAWCDVCKRYVCGRCAILVFTELDDAHFSWICPLCGERLGRDSEEAWLLEGDVTPSRFQDSVGDYGTVNWPAFVSHLYSHGTLRSARLHDLDALLAANDPDTFRRFEVEERDCVLRGDRVGQAHCASARAEILANRDPAAALIALRIAEACWRDIGNRWRLSQTLFSRYSLCRALGRSDAEMALDLQELASVAVGVHESIASFCEDEGTRLCIARRDFVGFVEHALRRPDSVRALEEMLASSTAMRSDTFRGRAAHTSQGLRWTVPDWEPPSLLSAEHLPDDARRGTLVARLLIAALDEGITYPHRLQDIAIELWSKTLGRRTPTLAWCVNELGRCVTQRMRFSEAASLYRLAAEIALRFARLDPVPFGKYLNNVGLCLANMTGQEDAALEVLNSAVAAAPSLREPHYWRAMIYWHRGDRELERDAWARYLEGASPSMRRSQAEQRLAALSETDEGTA